MSMYNEPLSLCGVARQRPCNVSDSDKVIRLTEYQKNAFSEPFDPSTVGDVTCITYGDQWITRTLNTIVDKMFTVRT